MHFFTMMSSQTHYYLCTGLFVIQRSWWRPPGPDLWPGVNILIISEIFTPGLRLTCWWRCAPCSGFHSGTPLRSGPPPFRWTVFCCGFDSIFGHCFLVTVGHMSCVWPTEPFLGHLKGRSALAGIFSSHQSIFKSREITCFNHCPFRLLRGC